VDARSTAKQGVECELDMGEGRERGREEREGKREDVDGKKMGS